MTNEKYCKMTIVKKSNSSINLKASHIKQRDKSIFYQIKSYNFAKSLIDVRKSQSSSI